MDLRLRSDHQLKTQASTQQYMNTSCANTSWVHQANIQASVSGRKSTMADYVVPRFHSRVKAGEKFFNNMHKSEIEVASAGTGYLIEQNVIGCTTTGAKALFRSTGDPILNFLPLQAADGKGVRIPTVYTAVSDAEVTRVSKAVSTEVLAKVGTVSSSLWETLAEYRQTMAMLENPLQRAADLSSRVLYSGTRGATGRQLLKEVSDGYLLYRYGILPIMKDINSILSSLKKRTGTREITSRAREQLSAASVVTGQTDFGVIRAFWSNQVNDVVTIRGMSLDKGYVSFANNAGLDLKGLALLPLQLTTYSFVADWFVNLSSYVGATLPAVGWNPLGSCLVVERNVGNAYRISSAILNPGTWGTMMQSPGGGCGVLSTSTTRGPLQPAAFVINSDFGFEKFTRAADLCALLASRFGKVSNLVGFRPNNSAFHDKKAYHAWLQQPGVL